MMISLCYTLIVLLAVSFIVWQFKMLKKYTLTYDKVSVNPQAGTVVINGQTIRFDDIECITVQEKQQPSFAEKALSKSAYYAYMIDMLVHLHNGATVKCTFNTKAALYQTLKKLEPFVPVKANIDAYKSSFPWGWVLLWVAAIIFLMFSRR